MTRKSMLADVFVGRPLSITTSSYLTAWGKQTAKTTQSVSESGTELFIELLHFGSPFAYTPVYKGQGYCSCCNSSTLNERL